MLDLPPSAGAFSDIYDLRGIVSKAGLGSVEVAFVVPHGGSVSSVRYLCVPRGTSHG